MIRKNKIVHLKIHKMTVIKTKEFFNDGKSGNNSLFDLYYFEEERVSGFVKKFLPLIGSDFKTSNSRLRYKEQEVGMEDFQIEKMYGNRIIKTPNQIAQEMYSVMTRPVSRGGKRFRDGKINTWYFLDGKCVYAVSCTWGRSTTWSCVCRLIYLGGPYGSTTQVRVFANRYLSY
jgi:hypothetical protein